MEQREEQWPEHLAPVRSVRGRLTRKQADLLYRAAAQVRDAAIVQVGAYRGRATAALALGARSGGRALVFAIDPHERFPGPKGEELGPEDRKALLRNVARMDLHEQVRVVNLPSAVVTSGWDRPVGLLWLDGDPHHDVMASELRMWSPHLTPGARVIVSDANIKGLGPDRVVEEAQSELGMVEIERAGRAIALEKRR